jgi:8-oxo-dGTP pyrophosphatase MutT (NUDIX family)
MIKKAGAIILNNDNSEIVLIHRADIGDWSFPKGHIGIGEDPFDACIREIKEETGLDVMLLRGLPDIEYKNGAGAMINLTMYLVRSRESSLKVEHPGDVLRWIDIDEAGNILSYDNLKEYYHEILPIIKGQTF